MNATDAIAASTGKQRLAGLLLLFGTGVVGTVAYALISGSDKPVTPVTQNPPSGTGTVIGATPTPGVTPTAAAGVFFISGSVDGLVPGAQRTLALTVTNPNAFPIRVLTVDTGVAVPASASCPAGSVEVGDYELADGGTELTAPANGTVRVDVSVSMVDSLTENQTGCRGVPFALTFEGTAEQVTS